jgi:hypothetical protein
MGSFMMNRIIVATAVTLLFTPVTAFAQDHELPDLGKTPGLALLTVPNDDKAAKCLTELMGDKVEAGDPITTTMICKADYDKCIRNVPAETKMKVFQAYGDPQGDHHSFCNVTQGCEVDHLISIEIGGSNDEKNLWPQPYSGLTWNAHVKDRLEDWYRANVCNGHVPLKTAQDEISSNWVKYFKVRIGPQPDSEAQ